MSHFVVSARKYRPLKWADVIGQEHVAHTLKNALAKGQIAHAFLFCGPRGVGKTTCARILARVLNCTQPTPDWEPCNSCDSCMASMENASFNIFELDAASNNSVDDIRELVEQVRYQPQAGKFKIYIVDEVHMLSTAAFNAFLKTLEEPPPFAKFILATTEKHKIIPTILSRCQIYDFRRIGEKDIVLQLQKIVEKEQLKAEEEALFLIAQKADGAMRDALSMFDRIKSFSGNEILYKDVLDNLNILDHDYYFKFVDAFLREDASASMLLLDDVLRYGFDPEVLLEGLAGHIRQLMVVKDLQMANLVEGSEALKQRYKNQAEANTVASLVTWLDLINEGDVNMVRARNKRLHTEILLLKLTYVSRKRQIAQNTSPTSEEKKNPLSSATNIPIPSEETAPILKPAKKEISKNPMTTNGLNIPKLGNIDQLKSKIIEEEKLRKENLIAFNDESALTFWNQLLESELPASLKAFMKVAVCGVEAHAMRILVGNVIARETIRAELKLDDRIRQTFADKNIRVYIEIDPSLAEQESKKPIKYYSAIEKWELMVQKNPNLAKFKEKLQLKLDED
ncbi:MAG: DNA polymerase III subunit gamma/tau [Saprospiraceae bacterium]|nr:DNA polymerase III subunit gamma/tau [Saprospiraceae bacterium]